MVSTGIYVRVSTEEQAREGFSIRAQEEKLRAYSLLKDWHIYGVYADEGISGKDIEGRPEIKRLISDITSGKVNNVLVYKIDRLTRSTKNLIDLVDLFNQNHCSFNSLNESIDTATATGRMFIKIVGIFAEFERENIVERVKLGFERKVKEGYSLCTVTSSYGYSRTKGEKIQTIEFEQAGIVKRVFEMYLHDDYSLNKISQILNAEKIPTKKGKLWNVKTIKLLLQNPNYIGRVRYACNDITKYFEVDGLHEPIIDEVVFFQAQEKIGKIKKITKTKRPSSNVYFCGVLYCPLCNSKLSPKWNYKQQANNTHKVGYPSYRCINALKGVCPAKTMSHAKVTTAFEEYVSRIEDFNVANHTDLREDLPPPDNSTEITAITSEIKAIEKKSEEIMSLFVSNTIDFATYQSMVRLNNERRGILDARLNILQSTQDNKEARYTAHEIISNLRMNWQTLNNEERLQFIQRFIKKISIQSDTQGDNRIHGNVEIHDIVFNEF